jgi:dephospho-CoA kinase
MRIIGLTGVIGSGKSTVSEILSEFGAVVINADKLGHEVFKVGTDGWRDIITAFGTDILKLDGEVDREKLGQLVFGDAASLARLNQLMHPQIKEMVKTQIETCRQKGEAVVVIEAPLLLEANWADLVNEIWVTVAPQSVILRRIKQRSGLAEDKVLTRIRSQMSSDERLKNADVVIDTDCEYDELKAKVGELWQRFKNSKRKGILPA